MQVQDKRTNKSLKEEHQPRNISQEQASFNMQCVLYTFRDPNLTARIIIGITLWLEIIVGGVRSQA